jgi:hypothetical protein
MFGSPVSIFTVNITMNNLLNLPEEWVPFVPDQYSLL